MTNQTPNPISEYAARQRDRIAELNQEVLHWKQRVEAAERELAAIKSQYALSLRLAEFIGKYANDPEETKKEYAPFGPVGVPWLDAILKERDELRAKVAMLEGVIKQHDLCHDLHGQVQADDFAAGCEAEQRKFYGCAPDADRVIEQDRRIAELENEVQGAIEGVMEIFRPQLESVGGQLTEANKRIAELAAALEPFANGHEYADEELLHLDNRDEHAINPYDDRSANYGDCRRAAEVLNKVVDAIPVDKYNGVVQMLERADSRIAELEKQLKEKS